MASLFILKYSIICIHQEQTWMTLDKLQLTELAKEYWTRD